MSSWEYVGESQDHIVQGLSEHSQVRHTGHSNSLEGTEPHLESPQENT